MGRTPTAVSKAAAGRPPARRAADQERRQRPVAGQRARARAAERPRRRQPKRRDHPTAAAAGTTSCLPPRRPRAGPHPLSPPPAPEAGTEARPAASRSGRRTRSSLVVGPGHRGGRDRRAARLQVAPGRRRERGPFRGDDGRPEPRRGDPVLRPPHPGQGLRQGREGDHRAFREDYAHDHQTVVRPSAEKYKAVVQAEVVAASVVRPREPGRVLLFVNQTTTSTRLDGPKVDLNRVRMTLEKVDGGGSSATSTARRPARALDGGAPGSILLAP